MEIVWQDPPERGNHKNMDKVEAMKARPGCWMIWSRGSVSTRALRALYPECEFRLVAKAGKQVTYARYIEK